MKSSGDLKFSDSCVKHFYTNKAYVSKLMREKQNKNQNENLSWDPIKNTGNSLIHSSKYDPQLRYHSKSSLVRTCD